MPDTSHEGIGISWFGTSCEVAWREKDGDIASVGEIDYAPRLPDGIELEKELGRDVCYTFDGKLATVSQILSEMLRAAFGLIPDHIRATCASARISHAAFLDTVALDALRDAANETKGFNATFVSHFQVAGEFADHRLVLKAGELIAVVFSSNSCEVSRLWRDANGIWLSVSAPFVYWFNSRSGQPDEPDSVGTIHAEHLNVIAKMINDLASGTDGAKTLCCLLVGHRTQCTDLRSRLETGRTNAYRIEICDRSAVCQSLVQSPKLLNENNSKDTLQMNIDEAASSEENYALDDPILQQIMDKARKTRLLFLVVGKSGVGKSSTINSLVGRAVAKVGKSKATTFEVTEYPVERNKIKMSFYDTPGLCDGLPTSGNDQVYLDRIRKGVAEFHSLWFVSRLDDTRVSGDEQKAIELLSNAFPDKGKIWDCAVIVLTRADGHALLDDPWPTCFHERASEIRAEIAKHCGKEVADRIPAVAVNNKSMLDPDGKPWRGELYLNVINSMKREGILTFYAGTGDLLDTRDPDADAYEKTLGSLTKKARRERTIEDDDDDDDYDSSSYSSRSQRRKVEAAVNTEVSRSYQERWRESGAKFDTKYGTGSVGKTIGEVAGWFVDKIKWW